MQTFKKKVFLVGSKPGIAASAARILVDNFGIEIVGCRHGYFKTLKQVSYTIEEIKALRAFCVICGMGAPKQEEFLFELKKAGWEGIGFTCGGYLDQIVYAGAIQYYPDWVERLNLRWLYRLANEPRKLVTRYFIEYQLFFREALILFAKTRKKARRK